MTTVKRERVKLPREAPIGGHQVPPLTNEEIRLLRHALGLDNVKVMYRNRYSSNGRHEVWEGLVAKGVADRASHGEGKMWWYWVTRTGFDAVREPDEKHDGETRFDCAN